MGLNLTKQPNFSQIKRVTSLSSINLNAFLFNLFLFNHWNYSKTNVQLWEGMQLWYEMGEIFLKRKLVMCNTLPGFCMDTLLKNRSLKLHHLLNLVIYHLFTVFINSVENYYSTVLYICTRVKSEEKKGKSLSFKKSENDISISRICVYLCVCWMPWSGNYVQYLILVNI